MFLRLMPFARIPDLYRLVGIPFVVDQGEVKLLAVEIGARHLHLHPVAKCIADSVTPPDEAVILLIEVVIVIGKVAYRHKTLTHAFIQFHIESPFGHARNQTIVDFAETVLHEFHLFVTDRSTLGIGGELLHVGIMTAFILELDLVDTTPPLRIFGQQPMTIMSG